MFIQMAGAVFSAGWQRQGKGRKCLRLSNGLKGPHKRASPLDTLLVPRRTRTRPQGAFSRKIFRAAHLTLRKAALKSSSIITV